MKGSQVTVKSGCHAQETTTCSNSQLDPNIHLLAPPSSPSSLDLLAAIPLDFSPSWTSLAPSCHSLPFNMDQEKFSATAAAVQQQIDALVETINDDDVLDVLFALRSLERDQLGIAREFWT